MPALPSTLRWLDISDNNIGPLATAWPPLLLDLKCNNDQMSSMASLPSSLVTLACSSNALTTLPTLPSTLTDLDLSGNLFSTLPILRHDRELL
jgi:Leucine-rich repeat (LRR) protein